MDEERKRRIWEEVIKRTDFISEVREDEVTRTELMEMFGLNRWELDKLIRKLKEDNLVEIRPAKKNGHACIAYKLLQK